MMNSSRLTKLLLRLFIVSICATALVGIVAIAAPGDTGHEYKIFLTTATIAVASVCGLACGGCLSRGHRILPITGLVLTGISACLILYGMWVRVGSEEFFWLVTCWLLIYAVACAHLSMLLMADLAGGYRWASLIAYQLIFGLATLLAVGITFDIIESEGYSRFTGVVSILVAAVTLIIPVFHYLSRDVVAAARAQADPLLAVEQEIARVKKRLIELESQRNSMLGRAGAGDGPAR